MTVQHCWHICFLKIFSFDFHTTTPSGSLFFFPMHLQEESVLLLFQTLIWKCLPAFLLGKPTLQLPHCIHACNLDSCYVLQTSFTYLRNCFIECLVVPHTQCVGNQFYFPSKTIHLVMFTISFLATTILQVISTTLTHLLSPLPYLKYGFQWGGVFIR